MHKTLTLLLTTTTTALQATEQTIPYKQHNLLTPDLITNYAILITILAVTAITLWLIKNKLKTNQPSPKIQHPLKITNRLPLKNNNNLYLITHQNQQYLIGETPQNITIHPITPSTNQSSTNENKK